MKFGEQKRFLVFTASLNMHIYCISFIIENNTACIFSLIYFCSNSNNPNRFQETNTKLVWDALLGAPSLKIMRAESTQILKYCFSPFSFPID